MNRGLINKSIREVWGATLLCGCGIMVFEMLLGFILRSFLVENIEQWYQVEFIQKIIQALLGAEIAENIGVEMLRTVAWVHPIILAMLWGYEIAICTRVPAGEVDRGTVDVLFGLPVSRWRIYVSESLVWAVGGVVVIGMGWLGSMLEGLSGPSEARLGAGQVLMIAANLYCLFLAVGALALLISSLSERRGRAVAVAFGIVLASFFLSFLAQFWEPAKALSFMTVLNYYQPMVVLRQAVWPVKDMAALLGFAIVLWTAGGCFFARRDICTV
ncbi:MAG: ABC transporter permease subunit [Phycisphaerae bacterium]|jgi:hypothetical protein